MNTDAATLKKLMEHAGQFASIARLVDDTPLNYNVEEGGFDAGSAVAVWNPHTDSADALDLAVNTGVELYPQVEHKGKSYAVAVCRIGSTAYSFYVQHGNDLRAAARWAILQAAARKGGYVG